MEHKYKTTDLWEAATLVTLGFKLEAIEDAQSGKDGQMTFAFKKTENIGEIAASYYSHDLLVDPNVLNYNVKDLRMRVRQAGQIRDKN